MKFNSRVLDKMANLKEPDISSSYSKDDCIFLLKDLSYLSLELSNEERERIINSGGHYSQMLPIEYHPSEEYMSVFHNSLKETSLLIAENVAIVSKKIMELRGNDVVLVSLARAGTPAGILIKRYIKYYYHIDSPHYSISIIRDVGIDENALFYILKNHPGKKIQFIDGWTGKGVINDTLIEALNVFNEKYGININNELAVIADPSYSVKIFGTREDFLIPSACLNSTVSGLVSRTVYRKDLIGEHDYHGARYYPENRQIDVSNYFIESICKYFDCIKIEKSHTNCDVTNKGLIDIKKIQSKFNIMNINKIKPGVGESTRVLLRRIPWKILVKDMDDPYVKHCLILAADRNVEVLKYEDMTYSIIGIIN